MTYTAKESSKLNYKKCLINVTNLTYNKLMNIITDDFNVSYKIKLYNFNGREIFDSSDLKFLELKEEKNKIILFCNEEHSSNISLDSYRLKCFKQLKKLGEGGFGKVYLAEQRFTKDKYAIKFLKLRAGKDINLIFQ